MRLLALLAIAACHRTATTEADAATAAAISTSASASAAPVVVPVEPRRALVRAWNDAHVSHDASALAPLYADDVVFYGTKLSRTECVARVAQAMKKHPDEKQVIKDVLIDGNKAAFTKSITTGGKTLDYHAYLNLEQRDGGGWVIAGESDTTSDANLEPCMSLHWNDDGDEKSTDAVELGGKLGCGFVSPEFDHDVPPDQGSFCVIELDKPICLLPGMGWFADETKMTSTVDPGGNPKALYERYGEDKHLVAKGTVFLPRTGHHHASLAMTVESYSVR